jgi:anti-sigma factor RsiW
MSMDCSKFELTLSDYLDGGLNRPEASLFRQHSLQCRACRRLMDDVKSAISDCNTQEKVESSLALEAALFTIPAEHTPLDCRGWEEVITEFLDGFVPAATYHRFEEHATACAVCSDLLTDVVYAVAACHSVHTYEEYDVTEALADRLLEVMPESRKGFLRKLADRVSAVAAFLMPRRTQGAPWSFATASILAFASVALLVFDFSEDLSVKGIYRQARVKAAEIYSRSSDIYAQKDQVVGRLQEVRSDIDEIWETMGGDTRPESERDAYDKREYARKANPDGSINLAPSH